MIEPNWELIKFKYEVLGVSLETLTTEYDVSLPVLKFNSKNWKQLPLEKQKPLDLDGLTSLEEIITKLGEETIEHTKAFSILKQKFLGPKYVELETVLLYKAIEMAGELNAKDPRSSATLRSITTVLTDLLAQNPLLSSGSETSGEDSNRDWKITFVNPESEEKDDG